MLLYWTTCMCLHQWQKYSRQYLFACSVFAVNKSSVRNIKKCVLSDKKNQSRYSFISFSELQAYPKSSRPWCCTNCGRTGRLAPWMTLWRNTWRTLPSKTPWGSRGTRSWSTWQTVWYFLTVGRFRSAPPQSLCAGWPASSQVNTKG